MSDPTDDQGPSVLRACTTSAASAGEARTIASMGPIIIDVEAAQRYEAHVEGHLAGILDYVVKRGHLALVHTEVLPAYRGRGIAGELARFALDDARRRDLRVIATCPAVRAYVERHPETQDIVTGFGPART